MMALGRIILDINRSEQYICIDAKIFDEYLDSDTILTMSEALDKSYSVSKITTVANV